MDKTSNIHHIALTVSNLKASKKFYDTVLTPLGFTLKEEDNICVFGGNIPEILLYPAKKAFISSKNRTYSPGIHHIALRTSHRSQVDEIFNIVKKFTVTILDTPKEYPQYTKGYYALFFLDPDHIKIEVAYIPDAMSELFP